MLRQLMLAKQIQQRKMALAELLEEEQALNTRAEELEAAIEEAETDEELAVVEESVAELETEKTQLAEKKSKLESEIAELESELEELKAKEPTPQKEPQPTRAKPQGGEIRMRHKFFREMTRDQVEDLFARAEVKEFVESRAPRGRVG